MTRKGYKQNPEHRRKAALSRLNSPVIKAQKKATKKRNELKRQIKQQQRQQQMQKGIKAWNNGREWPDEVKQNISRGMIAYWINRKELESKTQIV